MRGAAPRLRLTAWTPSEYDIQCSIVSSLRKFGHRDCLWFHIPNQSVGGVKRGVFLKAMGARAGASDLVFLMPGQPTLFLELKDIDGVQSSVQKHFQMLAETAGADYRLCRSSDEALRLLQERGIITRKLV